MRVELVTPFIQAAKEVLESEIGGALTRGQVRLERSPYTTQDVTTLVGVTGSLNGMVIYAMAGDTACMVVSRMMGQNFAEFDELAQSGIGELGNVITGRAAVLLAEHGLPCEITPPALIIGSGSHVATLDIDRVVVPLRTECGELQVQVILKPSHAVPVSLVA